MQDKLNALKTEYDQLTAQAKQYNATNNEGADGYNPFDSKIAALGEEICNLEYADKVAKQDAEWTIDVTVGRRAAWNSEIKSLSAADKLLPKGILLNNLAQKLGFKLDTLNKYVAKHNLAK